MTQYKAYGIIQSMYIRINSIQYNTYVKHESTYGCLYSVNWSMYMKHSVARAGLSTRCLCVCPGRHLACSDRQCCFDRIPLVCLYEGLTRYTPDVLVKSYNTEWLPGNLFWREINLVFNYRVREDGEGENTQRPSIVVDINLIIALEILYYFKFTDTRILFNHYVLTWKLIRFFCSQVTMKDIFEVWFLTDSNCRHLMS